MEALRRAIRGQTKASGFFEPEEFHRQSLFFGPAAIGVDFHPADRAFRIVKDFDLVAHRVKMGLS